MNRKVYFPTDRAKGDIKHHLPIAFNPFRILKESEIVKLAPRLGVNPNALANCYSHYTKKGNVNLFTCTPYTNLSFRGGTYAVGLTVVPSDILRYNTPKYEFLDQLKVAGLKCQKDLPASDHWSEEVKHFYLYLRETANEVRRLLNGIEPTHTRVNYIGFEDPNVFYAVHEAMIG